MFLKILYIYIHIYKIGHLAQEVVVLLVNVMNISTN